MIFSHDAIVLMYIKKSRNLLGSREPLYKIVHMPRYFVDGFISLNLIMLDVSWLLNISIMVHSMLVKPALHC